MQKLRTFMATCAALAMLLTACGGVPVSSRQSGGDAGDGTAQATNAIISVKVLTFPDPTVDALISAFYDKYPNYRVEKVALRLGNGTRLDDAIKQAMSQNDVDVLMLFGLSSLVKENQVAPLDAYIQKAKLDLKPYGPGIDQLKIDGKLYGLPYSISPQVLIYNQEMFQAAGVEKPQEGWTWEEFRATAAKLTKGTGDSKIYGFATDMPESLIGMYVNQKSGQAKMVDDPADLHDAFQLFSTMIFTDKSMPKAEKRDWTSNNVSFSDRDPFVDGKAAMSIQNLSWLRYGTSQVKFKWDLAPLPSTTKGQLTVQVNPRMLAITANSKNKGGAWEFVRFASGPEGAKVMARQGLFPMYQSPDVKTAWFEQQPAPPAGTEALFNTTYTIPQRDPAEKPEKMTEDAEKLFARLQNSANAALSGEQPWETALQEYLKTQDEIVKAMQ